ncbi:two component transcriptional regulator, LuxR family protein [Paenibacillus vortex V453]|uniref:DNA-binding response regulator n=2 Tax=Paenibacillus TaxID=44249 RepID=A0A163E2A7_9BACL|nr:MULTISPECIES: response regulator transcription factor [Paenibacillus]EFU39917.1 two component transcriptional regulator, LuxR family protein [Paenibacillus vortex V453]KZS43560.1 DNA-binding response regulator [Paenibacillus glucanolyticus]MDH6670477.1 DNA-binding NarL/FixJ family response regulator [Paenibacillus sp. LBL]MPY18289.1 response regulator transcription factor [Paenibacillus glucanolyticus]
MNRIQIFLVEDDPDWIKAMTVFLNAQEDMMVVGAADSPEQAIAMAAILSFDIVLMDIQLTAGRLDGIYTAAEIHELKPQAKVIMLTSLADEFVITQSYTAGAVNYLEKTRFKELPAAIRSAVLHPGTMEVLLKEFARLKREEQLRGLTPAEREVFELLDEGYSHSQMEKKLFKTESTLKNQINKILKKLGVKSSREAVEKVRRKGIVRQKDKS